MTTCTHKIFYIIHTTDTPRCVECFPPAEEPLKIGLKLQDGSLLSGRDLLQERIAIRSQVSQKAALELLSDAGWDGWEIVNHRMGRDGWPRLSKRYLNYRAETP